LRADRVVTDAEGRAEFLVDTGAATTLQLRAFTDEGAFAEALLHVSDEPSHLDVTAVPRGADAISFVEFGVFEAACDQLYLSGSEVPLPMVAARGLPRL